MITRKKQLQKNEVQKNYTLELSIASLLLETARGRAFAAM